MSRKNEIDIENPKSLFKYSCIEKNALSGLIKRTVWLADLRSFNDPFDSLFLFDDSFSFQDLADHLNSCAKSRGEPMTYTPSNVPEEKRKMLDYLAQRQRDLRSCGVVSFSATPYENLLWSHYANKHPGFCIEFERNCRNELGGIACSPVNYRDDTRVDGLDFFREPDRTVENVLHTKASCWSYELEGRLLLFPPVYHSGGIIFTEVGLVAGLRSVAGHPEKEHGLRVSLKARGTARWPARVCALRCSGVFASCCSTSPGMPARTTRRQGPCAATRGTEPGGPFLIPGAKENSR